MSAPDPALPSASSGKTCAASRVSISQLMNPSFANLLGNVHGGWIMKLVDEAGALASMRHSQQRVVTVALDQMTFRQSILIGASMEVEVHVEAENPVSGSRTHTNTAYLVYVALDERGRPVPVPRLHPETDAERERMEAGRLRQDYRKKQRGNG
jgi:acyl-CoA hydrolase